MPTCSFHQPMLPLLAAAVAVAAACPNAAAFSCVASGVSFRGSETATVCAQRRHAVRSTLFSASAILDNRVDISDIDQEQDAKNIVDRPLLREFGRGINERVQNSKEAYNRFGLSGHYTSEETIPCLNMQCGVGGGAYDDKISSRAAIRGAYTANDDHGHRVGNGGLGGVHGRSSGSGCSIIRLRGKDADSVRGLVNFADTFFEGVDDDASNTKINNVGIFRVENNVHAGFDPSVNGQDKMQVLYTKILPPPLTNNVNSGEAEEAKGEPVLLPLEVGELVGKQSVNNAHRGISTLADIGSQITSAILGMDRASTNKLLDDCTRAPSAAGRRAIDDCQESDDDGLSLLADDVHVANSYQRLIRYLKPPPQQIGEGAAKDYLADDDAAFWPHVDSTFLTLIPMPEISGLEVWCPSSKDAESVDLAQRGEWVRLVKPMSPENGGSDCADDQDVYVIALAGEFLQLLSNGDVPTCIHRVIAPKPPKSDAGYAPGKEMPYKQRVSAPLFLRPRRGEEAILNVKSDLNNDSLRNDSAMSTPASKGLYFEEGLLEECDDMRVWDYMDCMSPNN